MRDEDLPKSRLARFARMAALGSRAGVGKLLSAVGNEQAERRLALAAAEALGTMRGLAMKAGQMASYVDGLVPAEHRDTYEEAMRTLRAAAPTMSSEAALGVLSEELGGTPDSLFAEFDEVPFASASIGQVHRAQTKDGRAVAVKIQFEGIGEAIRADLANASLMTSLLGPIGTKLGAKEQMAEIRDRFLEELDYRHEASQQRRFAEAFAGHGKVRIPAVVDELSTARVLTTEMAPGIAFEQARDASEDERRAWAETLWVFVFRSLLHDGIFNADPHPGNYLFSEDGVVHFLDFGCTRELSARNVELVRRCHRCATAGDVAGLCDAALAMFELPTEGFAADLAREYIENCFRPIWTKGGFRITHDYAGSLLTDMRDNAVKVLKAREEFSPLPAEWAFFNRLQLGFYSVLARLDVEVDYNRLDATLLP
jgi:predicted unusual protein kinase regulating ubiquinone biosynthesis (AarF/ABC1/UbiB family)